MMYYLSIRDAVPFTLVTNIFPASLRLRCPGQRLEFRVKPSPCMDTSDEDTVQPTLKVEDEEPSKHQHLKKRGRSNSPVVVYDCDQKTVQIRNKKNVGQ